MDQVPLVSHQIETGQKAVARLVEAGFPVKAAAWVKETDGGFWFLYLVSPVVDRQGPLKAYGRINAVIGDLRRESFGTDPLEIKAIGVAGAVGKAIVEAGESLGGRRPGWFRGNRLGEVEIDAAYLYGPIGTPTSSDVA
jgi:hypothetical protein